MTKEKEEYNINKIVNSLLLNYKEIEDIFIDYFGEENVDLQGIDKVETALKIIIKSKEINYPIEISREEENGEETFKVLQETNKSKFLDLDEDTQNIVIANMNKLQAKYKILMLEEITIIDIKVSIIVRFPKVTVTNELGESIEVQDLFVKTDIKFNQRISGDFTMLKSTYTEAQYNSGYLHSHAQPVNPMRVKWWTACCLGQGPIKYTIDSLIDGAHIDFWKLYVVELDRYVKTESVEGIPYIFLSKVSFLNDSNATLTLDNTWDKCIMNFHSLGERTSWEEYSELIKEFTKYINEHNFFKFNYVNNSIDIAESFFRFSIRISNEFIKYINILNKGKEDPYTLENFLSKGVLFYSQLKGRKLLYYKNIENPYKNHQNNKIITFKGDDYNLKIIKETSDFKPLILLNPTIINRVVSRILLILNYIYGNTKIKNKERIYYI